MPGSKLNGRFLARTAGIRAVLYFVPVFSPAFAPCHLAAAGDADFAGQRCFVAFEPGRWAA